MTWRPKVRWVLLAAFAVVLCLPLAGLGALRMYQTELVRRAESELVSQGTMVQASYTQLLLSELRAGTSSASETTPTPQEYAVPTEVKWHKKIENWFKPKSVYFGLFPGEVHGPPPDPREPTEPADPHALRAGEQLEDQLRNADRLTRSDVRVLDYKGTVVASTDGHREFSLLHREEVSRALHGKFVRMLRRRAPDPKSGSDTDRGSRPRGADIDVSVALPVVHGDRLLGVVLLSKSPLRLSTALARTPSLAWATLGLTLFGLIALLALARYYFDRPVAALMGQTERLESQREAAPIEAPGTDEFARLSEVLADLGSEDSPGDDSG